MTDSLEDLHRRAQTAVQRGDLRAAHQHCLKILEQQPHHADAWFLCGVIASHNKQFTKAEQIVSRAIALSPLRADYHAELAKLYSRMRQPQNALRAARLGLSLAPTDPPTLDTLGVAFSHAGEHAPALQCFESAVTALKKKPPTASTDKAWLAELYFNYAASLKFSGRFEEAETAYEHTIELQPGHYRAHSALSELRPQTASSNHLARLQALSAKVSSAEEQLHLGHAIAKEQEDLGQFEGALTSLSWAKRAQRDKVGYSAEWDAALFDRVRQGFQGAPVSAGYNTTEPIFIVGMPRTGTTLVERILSSHSSVFAAGELQNFPLQVKRMTGTESNEVLDEETIGRASTLDRARLGQGYLDSTRPRTGASAHFVDKLPLNFIYLGLIAEALPQAKLICLRRDPMDTCLSNYRQLFATNFRYYYYNYDLLDCGRYYLQFQRLIEHWRTLLGPQLYELSYEGLVAEPEPTARALLDHCGLQWEPQCLQFQHSQAPVATASAVQVRSGIYSTSVQRWRRYGTALDPLVELLAAAGIQPSR